MTIAFEATSSPLGFITIDDLSDLAQKLVDGLNKLGERKHPLSIRRGKKFLVEKNGRCEMLKTRTKTYFFDVKETQGGRPYLVITECRLKHGSTKPERSNIIVFQENLTVFASLVTKMSEKINQGN